MKELVQHQVYGDIVYEESFWTGKKTLTVNGVDAQPVSKKEFMIDGKKAIIKGSYLTGIDLCVEGDTIEMSPKPKWYEVVIAILPLIFLLTWGNSVALCSIFPVVGGAIGGALGAIGAMMSLLLMKKSKSLMSKLLIGICACAVTILIAYALALALLAFVY